MIYIYIHPIAWKFNQQVFGWTVRIDSHGWSLSAEASPGGIWHWLPETSLEKTLRGTATQKGCTEKVSWIVLFITCQPKLAVFDQCTSCLRMCFVERGWNGDVPSCRLHLLHLHKYTHRHQSNHTRTLTPHTQASFAWLFAHLYVVRCVGFYLAILCCLVCNLLLLKVKMFFQ